jgi:hypothetical protein
MTCHGRILVVLAAACLAVAMPAAAQPRNPGTVLTTQKSGAVTFDLFWQVTAETKTAGKSSGQLADAQNPWLAKIEKRDGRDSLIGTSVNALIAGIKGMKFLLDVQVQDPKTKSDIIDFAAYKGTGPGATVFAAPLCIRLTFNGKEDVPPFIYLVGDKGADLAVVALSTTEDYRVAGRFYDVELMKDDDNSAVLWLVVYRWPAGDPRICG